MAELLASTANVRTSIQTMRDSISKFPSEAKLLLLARDELASALDDFVQQINSTESQIQEIDALLSRLLSTAHEGMRN